MQPRRSSLAAFDRRTLSCHRRDVNVANSRTVSEEQRADAAVNHGQRARIEQNAHARPARLARSPAPAPPATPQRAASGAIVEPPDDHDKDNRQAGQRPPPSSRWPCSMNRSQGPESQSARDTETGCSRTCSASRARPCRRRTSSPGRRPRSAGTWRSTSTTARRCGQRLCDSVTSARVT